MARNSSLSKTLSSYRLEDLEDDLLFDNDVQDWNGVQQLPRGITDQAASRGCDLRPAAAAAEKQQDIPLPPPERPYKWNTKLADRATAAVNLEAHYAMPPHLLFELLADPTQHDKIFDAILAADAELLEDNGSCRKWRLDYTARWNFWKVSGVCENRLLMWTDSDAGTVTFKLREPGFLKRYEGTWTIKAACGSPLAAFNAPPAAAAVTSPANSMFDLVSSISSSGSSSSSRGSSRSSTPRSSGSHSWADGVPTAEIFGGNLSRGGSGDSGTSSGSSISMRTVTAAAPAGLPQALTQAAFSAASLLGATVSSLGSAVSRWWAPVNNSTTAPTGSSSSTATAHAAATTISSSSRANDDQTTSWPPLFKSPQGLTLHAFSNSSSSGTRELEGPEAPVQRPMPTSAVITVASLTSPNLTPPYPLNQCLKIQSKGQVGDMLEGLVRAAASKLQAQPLQGL